MIIKKDVKITLADAIANEGGIELAIAVCRQAKKDLEAAYLRRDFQQIRENENFFRSSPWMTYLSATCGEQIIKAVQYHIGLTEDDMMMIYWEMGGIYDEYKEYRN
jgi:hypothetical protein